jgi:hypothetical protein
MLAQLCTRDVRLPQKEMKKWRTSKNIPWHALLLPQLSSLPLGILNRKKDTKVEVRVKKGQSGGLDCRKVEQGLTDVVDTDQSVW